MHGNVLFDAAEVCNLLEVIVELLIGKHGYNLPLLLALRIVFVLVGQGQGWWQQGHIAGYPRLLAGGKEPGLAIGPLLNLAGRQVAYVRVAKSRKAGKKERVTHALGALGVQPLLHHAG